VIYIITEKAGLRLIQALYLKTNKGTFTQVKGLIL
jgi:hypothetical protein